jgi:phosphatidylglycerophosphate synthase
MTFHPLILLYPANLVSLIRVGCIVAAVLLIALGGNDPQTQKPMIVLLLSSCGLLDILDGYLARKYQHVTRFGIYFDQAIDLVMHTFLWSLSGFILAIPILLLEWSTGLAVLFNTAQKNKGYWKTTLLASDWWFIKQYFASGQRNWLSILANVSHFIFPLALYLQPDFTEVALLKVIMLPGLLCYEAATLLMLLVFLGFKKHRG